MEITRRADYAIRMLIELAGRGDGAPVSARRLAELGGVPYAFARSVAHDLVAAGLAISRRGVAGGLALAREASSISLLDVVEATQGPVSVAVCARDPDWCERMGSCKVHGVWCGAGALLERYLASKDIASLVPSRKDGE